MQNISKLVLLVALVIATFSSTAKEKHSSISTMIEKTVSDEWFVTYRSEKPVNRIAFSRNPNDARTTRWRSIDPAFQIVHENNQEYIQKVNGDSFKEVKIKLTATYQHLPKDYAPFSPYSDKGMLFHSGRLFACAETCADDINGWRMGLRIPQEEHAIVKGELYTEFVEWTDYNSGQNIYVGIQDPIENQHFIAVIDTGLPKQIYQQLSVELPKMMLYFAERMGTNEGQIKPMLYASYAMVDGTSSQGGTLENQIFMHWDKNNLDVAVKEQEFTYDTLRFFAHEAAHLFQYLEDNNIGPEHSWLHEGHADYLAADALLKMYPVTKDYIMMVEQRTYQHCIDGLASLSLVEAADQGQFYLYYTCGYWILRSIDNVMLQDNQAPSTAYELWRGFKNTPKPLTIDKAFAVLSQISSEEMAKAVKHFVFSNHQNSEEALRRLLNQEPNHKTEATK